MMTHYYTAKRFGRGADRYQDQAVKLLCSGQTIPYSARPANDRDHAVTVAHNVTCGACLEILIPVQERKLQIMKNALTIARGGIP